MDRKQIMSIIRKRAEWSVFYQRLLDAVNNMSEEEYEICMSDLESKNFYDELDFVIFMEGGF